jgi:hypothetical protein
MLGDQLATGTSVKRVQGLRGISRYVGPIKHNER